MPLPSSFGLCLDPNESRYVFETFGLPPVSVQLTIPHPDSIEDPAAKAKAAADRNQIRDQFMLEENSEGAVVYCLCRDSATGIQRIWRIYKHKNETYAFRRAIREQMRRRADSGKINERIRKLHFKHTKLEEMTQQGLQFNAWCRKLEKDGKLKWEELFSQWVDREEEFLKVPLRVRQDILKEFDEKQARSAPVAVTGETEQIQIFGMGPPGTGKSTTLKVLEKIIPNAKRINQDETGGKRNEYLKLATSLSDPASKVSVLLLDKCNHDVRVRRDTYEALRKGRRVFIQFIHPDDDPSTSLENTVKMAYWRINTRGQGHPTLYPCPKLESIIQGFQTSWQNLSTDEMDEAALVFQVDITRSLADIASTILSNLEDCGILTLKSTIKDGLAAKIDGAIADVKAEERRMSLSTNRDKRTLFWSAQITDRSSLDLEDHPELLGLLKEKSTFQLRKAYHCTLLYLGGKDPKSDEEVQTSRHYEAKEGETITLRGMRLHFDGKCIALELEKDFPCSNVHAHVTVALQPGVQPVYSNQLISSGTGQTVNFPVQLQAVITRVVAIDAR